LLHRERPYPLLGHYGVKHFEFPPMYIEGSI